MPQIFPKAMNPVARIIILGFPLFAGMTGVGLAAFYRSGYATGVGEIPPQPVAFSHAHHVGQLGIDCRYCHDTVERSGFANVPPSKTCMNCHQQIWQGSDLLQPVRDSYDPKYSSKPEYALQWNRVYNLPHYAYFNHSIHVAKGVGCVTCHGQLDEMNLTLQHSTLLMEWCINCHREPEKHLRPRSEVTSMTYKLGNIENGKPAVWKPEDFPHNGWQADGKSRNSYVGQDRPTTQKEMGRILKDEYMIRDKVTLTNCSMCHR